MLVTKPKALLLDEPLGDLDRLLQLRMRVELRNLQRQLGLMFIHVTHNQEEALSMADRIVVMNEARIQQIADPLTIATRPATELVARFMGDNNIIRGKVIERDGGRLVVEDEHGVRVSVRAPGTKRRRRRRDGDRLGSRGGRRDRRGDGARRRVNSAECEIIFVEFLGDLVKLHLIAGGERMLAKVPGEQYPTLRGREGETGPDLLEGGGCPAPLRLSSRADPHLDVEDIEADEQEVEHEHERALGVEQGRAAASEAAAG